MARNEKMKKTIQGINFVEILTFVSLFLDYALVLVVASETRIAARVEPDNLILLRRIRSLAGDSESVS